MSGKDDVIQQGTNSYLTAMNTFGKSHKSTATAQTEKPSKVSSVFVKVSRPPPPPPPPAPPPPPLPLHPLSGKFVKIISIGNGKVHKLPIVIEKASKESPSSVKFPNSPPPPPPPPPPMVGKFPIFTNTDPGKAHKLPILTESSSKASASLVRIPKLSPPPPPVPPPLPPLSGKLLRNSNTDNGKVHKLPTVTERASKGSPSLVKVPKPAPAPAPPLSPSPPPLRGENVKSLNNDSGKVHKTPIVVSKVQGSDIIKDRKVGVAEVDRQQETTRRLQHTLAKAAPVYKSSGGRDKPQAKEKRSDPLRISKEASLKPGLGHKSSRQIVKPLAKDADKRGDSLRKSRETSVLKVASNVKVSGTEDSILSPDAQTFPWKPESSAKKVEDHKSPSLGLSGKIPYGPLCNECKAALQGTVCFIGNDGRVSASSGRLGLNANNCKSPTCAANNPDYLSATAVPRKNYLLSKRHLQKAHLPAKNKNNYIAAPAADRNGVSRSLSSPYRDSGLEDERSCSDDEGVYNSDSSTQKAFLEVQCDGHMAPEINYSDSTGSVESLNMKNAGGSNYARRNHLTPGEEQEAETVFLRKHLIQERKQGGEWMMNCAIDEAMQKLAPTEKTRVKALVEAFESIISHTDGESQEPHHTAGTVEQHTLPRTNIALHC